MGNNFQTVDLGEIIKFFIRRIWIILIFIIVGGIIGFGANRCLTSSSYLISLNAQLPQYNGIGTVNTIIEIANGEIADKTFNDLGMEKGSILVIAQSRKNSNIIDIKLTGKDKENLVKYAARYRDNLKTVASDYVNQSLIYEFVKSTLSSNNPKNIDQLKKDFETVVKPVIINGEINSPIFLDNIKSKRLILLGVFFGGLVGVMVVLAWFLMQRIH